MSHDPLPSWNDGATKRAILDFLAHSTKDGGPEFIPESERVAVFDNDGTLWCEKPLPIQADFLLEAVGKMGEHDPSLRERQPWKAVYEKDYRWLSGVIEKHYKGDDGDLKLMASGLLQAYAGITVEDYEAAAGRFLGTAHHPRLNRPYRRCTYQPMIELLGALDSHGFTNYIVTSSGQDFMRPAADDLYNVPPERIIGSDVALEYLDGSSVASIIRKPELGIFDDGAAKPVQIWGRTGRRPVFACGNSNGDIAMLHFCARPSRHSLALLLEHDDEEREFSYVAGAEESLRRAAIEGWTVASMKNDWKTVFPL
jgi:phosphoglycolate phosphatase-like HAD superfamily hydrolase